MFDRPKPIGNRILLEVEITEKKEIKSDKIYVPKSVQEEDDMRALLNSGIGKVISMGQVALESAILSKEEDEIKPGDLVTFLKNSGSPYDHPDEGKMYRLLTRGDIMAVVGTEEEQE